MNLLRACPIPILALLALLVGACGGSGSGTDVAAVPDPEPAPTLTGVFPGIGPNTGGFAITLEGSGFVDGDPGINTVEVAGMAATGVLVVDDTMLTCVVPAGANGPAAVTLTNANGTVSLPAACTYFEPLSVDKPVALPGEPVTFRDVGGTVWDFGDGNPPAGGALVTHRYSSAGTYRVQVVGGTRFVDIQILSEPAPALTLRSHMTFSNASSGMWAHNDLAFVPGISDGVIHVVDISDPDNPVERSTITDAGGARGIRSFGHYIATAKESGGNGCDIYDVSDPDAPFKVATLATGLRAHNVGIWDNLLILDGLVGQSSEPGAPSGTLSLIFYDVTDPTAPTYAGAWDGGVYVHDSTKIGDRIYCASGTDGFHIIDTADLMAPTVLGQWSVPGYAHNIWPNADGTVVYTTEETAGQHLKIWNSTDPADVQFIVEWAPTDVNPIIHNVVVVGDYAYVAYYTYGLSVIDVSDPAAPFETFHFDTFAPNDNTVFNGAWMVYPFGDTVMVSDISTGLWIWTK